tara:strand:+ start:1837 stop:3057 length:1221 start_codon:yes stop_codon:yes gene_type:complete
MIELRTFPYPYKAMLAISNDIDNSPDLNVFLEIMDYLNSSKQTVFGNGLNLEVGNSFWFYNNTGTEQLSYFKGTSTAETNFAPHCREFWQSGFIDSIHTYGNFDSGGFKRKFALTARDEMGKYNVKLPVWINHGTHQNSQNLGYVQGCYGGVQGHESYHADLIKDFGIRYIWAGKMTHVLGQDAQNTLSVKGIQFLQNITAKLKYKDEYEKIILSGNKLIAPITLQDKTTLWEFQRWINAWGRQTVLDVNDFTQQIAKKNIRGLIRNEGFMVLYTHFCENLKLKEGFPTKLKTNLRFIREEYNSGELLVTTTSRLLRYKEITIYIKTDVHEENGKTIFAIPSTMKTPLGKQNITLSDIEGLTFYTDEQEKTEIHFMGKCLASKTNPRDHTGKVSISIPWIQLEYHR